MLNWLLCKLGFHRWQWSIIMGRWPHQARGYQYCDRCPKLRVVRGYIR